MTATDDIAYLTKSRLTQPAYTPPPHVLKQDETDALESIKAHFSSDGYAVPGSNEPLSDREMMFLSQETILKFYNGQTRDNGAGTPDGIKATIERLERTLAWRRAAGVEDVQAAAERVNEQMETSAVFTLGYGSTGMPIIYFFPMRNYLPNEKRSIDLPFFILERARDLMVNGQTQIVVVFSFSGTRQGPTPTLQLTKDMINTFADYYPETLGTALLMDVPWYVRAFINLVWPFVDPYTKAKVRQIPGAQAVADGLMGAGDLLKECGGQLDLPYDHKTYSTTLVEAALKCREEQHAQWLKLGPREVGREERLFKIATTTRAPGA